MDMDDSCHVLCQARSRSNAVRNNGGRKSENPVMAITEWADDSRKAGPRKDRTPQPQYTV
eukprot:5323098-Pleurochrysis_carterae.AAC.1